jgi:uncharacterized protein YndB with AHSA1/START domain
MKNITLHKTVKIQKLLKFPVHKVFKAFSEVKERAKWSVPKGDAVIYLKSNFKIDGKDVFKCGPIGSLHFTGKVHYEYIVKNEKIISTETIIYQKKILSSALTSLELIPTLQGTKLIMTAQIASFTGSDMSRGYKQGWTSVLKNLDEFLKK